MYDNDLGARLSQLRRDGGMTQEQLAARLGVTFQAVSKWETGVSCPDIQLLPQLADVFGVTLDALFGRVPALTEEQEEAALCRTDLPWPDDDTLYAVLYHGHTLLTDEPAALGRDREIRFVYQGPAVNISSRFDVACESGTTVEGDIKAGCDVRCGSVGGGASAGCDVNCSDTIHGSVSAGCDVSCGNVTGDVKAGCDVTCGDVGGSVHAGGDVTHVHR